MRRNKFNLILLFHNKKRLLFHTDCRRIVVVLEVGRDEQRHVHNGIGTIPMVVMVIMCYVWYGTILLCTSARKHHPTFCCTKKDMVFNNKKLIF